MGTNQEIPDKLRFRISPRTMQMLGRQNISSPIIAVTELVKNAYDADATEVILRFRSASTEDGSIIIEDNGDGMSIADLVENWMVISTDNKLHNPLTNRERVKVGEKGIGRLGLDRLARRTDITTYNRDGLGLQLTIDWTKYECDEGDLEHIEHPLSPVSMCEDDHPGTTLRLTGLRDRWSRLQYEALYRDLSLLVPPFEADLSDFRIILDCDECPDLSGPIISPMAEVAEYKLSSNLSSEGTIFYRLQHRSGDIVEDKLAWHEAFDDAIASHKLPVCGSMYCTIYFYFREPSLLREAGVKRADLDNFLKRFQGVRIYRDNFRVKPYGDPFSLRGDRDWLLLNERRVQHPAGVGHPIGEWRVAENQVVGSVFITKYSNPELLDQTNREGLEENQAFYDMRKFVLHGIQFFERERQKRFHREQKTQEQKPEVEVPSALSAVKKQLQEQSQEFELETRKLREKANSLKGSFAEAAAPELVAIAESLERAVNQNEAIVEDLEAVEVTYSEEATERQLMISLATLGIAMAAFGHETSRAVNQVLGQAVFIKDYLDVLPQDRRSKAFSDLDMLIEHAERIEAWGKFALDRVRRDKRTRTNIDLNETIQLPLHAFEGILTRRSILLEPTPSWGKDLPLLRAFKMDIEAIIINFLTNAIEALNPASLQNRRIFIATAYNPMHRFFEIVFSDSGKGIRTEDIHQIWNPLFSTKVDEQEQPIGTGLGLTIVKNIVEEYEGEIEVKGHGQLGGGRISSYYSSPLFKSRGNQQ